MQTTVEQVQLSDLGSWFGKMYPELLAQTKVQTSEPSCKKRSVSSAKKPPLFLCLQVDGQQPDASLMWKDIGVLRGAYSTLSFGGVPQRRRRIALVADFGGPTAPEILFERESVSGNSAQSGSAREGATTSAEKCSGTAGSDRLSYCIQGNCIDRADTAGCNGRGRTEGVSYTLNTVDRPAVYDARGNGDGKVAPTMTGDHNNRATDYTAVVVRGGLTVAGFKSRAGEKSDIAYQVEQSPTLLAGCDDASVIIAPTGFSQATYDNFSKTDKSATLKAQGGSYGGG